MDVVEFEGTKHFFPKGFLEENPMTEEYEDDPRSYYEEFHLAYMFEGKLYNFWGTICIDLGECSNDQLCDVVEKLIDFEMTIADRLA